MYVKFFPVWCALFTQSKWTKKKDALIILSPEICLIHFFGPCFHCLSNKIAPQTDENLITVYCLLCCHSKNFIQCIFVLRLLFVLLHRIFFSTLKITAFTLITGGGKTNAQNIKHQVTFRMLLLVWEYNSKRVHTQTFLVCCAINSHFPRQSLCEI